MTIYIHVCIRKDSLTFKQKAYEPRQERLTGKELREYLAARKQSIYDHYASFQEALKESDAEERKRKKMKEPKEIPQVNLQDLVG